MWYNLAKGGKENQNELSSFGKKKDCFWMMKIFTQFVVGYYYFLSSSSS